MDMLEIIDPGERRDTIVPIGDAKPEHRSDVVTLEGLGNQHVAPSERLDATVHGP
jgi:hypothetical protein